MPEKKIVRCNFCDRPENEVKKMVTGNGSAICDRCIGGAVEALGRSVQKKEEEEAQPLRKPREIKTFLDQYVISQERAKTDIAVAIYNHYKRREALKRGVAVASDLAGVEIEKSNILMLGPSGTGKTEIARTIARMLGVPFAIADATRFTQAGYVGDDVESMLQSLVGAAGGDIERAQWGIVFIDEIDKLARKSGRNASGYRDVTGEGVQQALLKIIEGSKIQLPRGMARVIGGSGQTTDLIDTTNILFVGSGSFAGGLKEVVDRRINKSARMGFGSSDTRKRDLSEKDVYDNATEADILEFGIIPELMGRLPVLTTTLPLTEEELVLILTEPKNSLVKQFRALFAMDGIDLQFEEAALKAIGREALRRPTGARALRSIVEATVKKYAFECPSDDGIKVVRITEDVVEKGCEATIVRESQPKVEKQAAKG